MHSMIRVDGKAGTSPAVWLLVTPATEDQISTWMQITIWTEEQGRKLVADLQTAIDKAFIEEAGND